MFRWLLVKSGCVWFDYISTHCQDAASSPLDPEPVCPPCPREDRSTEVDRHRRRSLLRRNKHRNTSTFLPLTHKHLVSSICGSFSWKRTWKTKIVAFSSHVIIHSHSKMDRLSVQLQQSKALSSRLLRVSYQLGVYGGLYTMMGVLGQLNCKKASRQIRIYFCLATSTVIDTTYPTCSYAIMFKIQVKIFICMQTSSLPWMGFTYVHKSTPHLLFFDYFEIILYGGPGQTVAMWVNSLPKVATQ